MESRGAMARCLHSLSTTSHYSSQTSSSIHLAPSFPSQPSKFSPSARISTSLPRPSRHTPITSHHTQPTSPPHPHTTPTQSPPPPRTRLCGPPPAKPSTPFPQRSRVHAFFTQEIAQRALAGGPHRMRLARLTQRAKTTFVEHDIAGLTASRPAMGKKLGNRLEHVIGLRRRRAGGRRGGRPLGGRGMLAVLVH